jgi:hypothetical protein
MPTVTQERAAVKQKFATGAAVDGCGGQGWVNDGAPSMTNAT